MLLQANDYLLAPRPRGLSSCRSAARTSGATSSAGVDLIRRSSGAAVHALAWPLITAAGRHEARQDDRGPDLARPAPHQPVPVLPALDGHRRPPGRASSWPQFTLLPVDRDRRGRRRARGRARAPRAQRPLAREATALVHGARRPAAAEEAAPCAVRRPGRRRSPPAALEAVLRRGRRPPRPPQPSSTQGLDLVDALAPRPALARSTSEARRAIGQGGAYVNGERAPEGRRLARRTCSTAGLSCSREGKRNHAAARGRRLTTTAERRR